MNEEILEYIQDIADEQGVSVLENDDLFKAGVLDSLRFIMLLSYLQDRFGLAFNEEDMKPENYVSINAIIEFCNKKAHRV